MSSSSSNPLPNTPPTPTTSNSIPTSMPTPTPNGSVPNTPQTLDTLLSRFSLPSATISLTRYIFKSIPTPHDFSSPVQALYLALLHTLPSNTPCLTTLLSTVQPPINLPHFLYRLRIFTSDLTSLPSCLSSLSTAISDLHHAFTISSHTYRKLQLLTPQIHPTFSSQIPWLLFLLSKSQLFAHRTLTPLSSFHLLLACLYECHYLSNSFPLSTIQSVATPVQSELTRFRSLFRNSLPHAVKSLLPLHTTPNSPNLLPMLHHYYSRYLQTSPKTLLAPDERLFLSIPSTTLPHISIQSNRQSADPLMTPSPSSRKRKISAVDNPVQTPRTRAHLLSQRMALTPTQNRLSTYVSSFRGADALDALAAVASSTPHSPIVPTPTAYIAPATPISAACRAVEWLQSLADARPETAKDLTWWRPGVEDVSSTKAMTDIVREESVWKDIVKFVKETGRKVEETMPDMGGKERGREAAALFFATLEAIFVREKERLKDRPAWIVDNLKRAKSVRKSLMVCVWEATAAAYGRRDLVMFKALLKLLEVPPLDIVKAIHPFLRLRDLPRAISEHIIVCGNHVLDSMAWKPDSILVVALRRRAREMAMEKYRSVSPAPTGGWSEGDNEKTEESSEGDTAKNEGRSEGDTAKNEGRSDGDTAKAEGPSEGNKAKKEGSSEGDKAKTEKVAVTPPKNVTREFTLEVFFKRLLLVASERAQELLFKLNMDVIAEYVWQSIKYAVWEKWHLMVGRHLDQIIMCCVYGVARVRKHDLKFREIIHAYQSMNHVREPSFANLVPAVFRDVLLDPFLNLMPPDRVGVQHSIRSSEMRINRGDIIKLYNQVFIHAMKAFLLRFQVYPPGFPVAAQQVAPRGESFGTSGRTTNASHLMSTPNSILSAASRRMSGRDENGLGHAKDVLRQKVLSSPMRVRRPFASPKRYGRVTVSPMRSGGQSLLRQRPSPGQRATPHLVGGMTPGTRRLYAFGESPVHNPTSISRNLADDSEIITGLEAGRVRRPAPLKLDGGGSYQRSALIRRRLVDALGKNQARESPNGAPGEASSSDGSVSVESGSDVESKSEGVDT